MNPPKHTNTKDCPACAIIERIRTEFGNTEAPNFHGFKHDVQVAQNHIEGLLHFNGVTVSSVREIASHQELNLRDVTDEQISILISASVIMIATVLTLEKFIDANPEKFPEVQPSAIDEALKRGFN